MFIICSKLCASEHATVENVVSFTSSWLFFMQILFSKTVFHNRDVDTETDTDEQRCKKMIGIVFQSSAPKHSYV